MRTEEEEDRLFELFKQQLKMSCIEPELVDNRFAYGDHRRNIIIATANPAIILHKKEGDFTEDDTEIFISI
ncbi:MAG: hypothetical protein ACT6FG_00005 [Methanosarcinaceae archaeon]